MVRIAQLIYINAQSRVRVNGTFGHDFLVQVGQYEGPVFSLLLFTIVLQAISRSRFPELGQDVQKNCFMLVPGT